LGRFILTKPKDNSFELHGQTESFNNNGLIGTMFNAFAAQTSDSSIVQVQLSNSSSLYPFLSMFFEN
jgi:hypothetical protein